MLQKEGLIKNGEGTKDKEFEGAIDEVSEMLLRENKKKSSEGDKNEPKKALKNIKKMDR